MIESNPQTKKGSAIFYTGFQVKIMSIMSFFFSLSNSYRIKWSLATYVSWSLVISMLIVYRGWETTMKLVKGHWLNNLHFLLINDSTYIIPSSCSRTDILFINQSNFILDNTIYSLLHHNCHWQIIYARVSKRLLWGKRKYYTIYECSYWKLRLAKTIRAMSRFILLTERCRTL